MDGSQYRSYLSDPEKYMKRVREEWDIFLETGAANGLSVRNEVLESWKRSLENGLSFDGAGAALILDEKMMRKIVRKSSMLLDAADPVMAEFADMMKNRGANNCVINLCNEDTVILRTVSCGDEGEQAAKYQHILPGAILDEKHTGTTGVSLALATKSPYVLYGPEHFRQSARICSCAAAPIMNIRNKKIKGIIALSGEEFDIVPDTIGMVTFIARTIESNLLINHIRNEEFLTNRFREQLRFDAGKLLITIDSDLNVIASSSNMHPLTQGLADRKNGEKKVAKIVKKANEKYLYGSMGEEPAATSTEESEEYHLEFIPVYRDTAYIGMILTAKPKAFELQRESGVSRSSGKVQTNLAGHSRAFMAALNTAVNVAPTDAPVMLLGETGTGKEVFAKTIFENSSRADKPYIAINCGALPRELIGSELFGYAAGAFTGASQKGNPGKLEAANKGTIFLDEIGAMPLDAQSYLLRVIEENELYRLGSAKPIPIDVRIICATNENLPDLIDSKLFRADLYYRLNVVEINLPSLRERGDDLAELISYFSIKYFGEPCIVSDADLAVIGGYTWPGNVRELKNVIHSASVLNTDPVAALKNYVAVHYRAGKAVPEHRLENASFAQEGDTDLDRVLDACGGNIAKAARQLGVARSTIYRRMRRNS